MPKTIRIKRILSHEEAQSTTIENDDKEVI
ncbi:MAG: hypothetical protein ACFWUI_00925 [Clostridium sp.]|jgi:hypothetical protein